MSYLLQRMTNWFSDSPARLLHSFMLFLVGIVCCPGCASFTNPAASYGIPVSRVPTEFLGRPREQQQLVPFTRLRHPQVTIYKLAPGDVLGVYVEGVVGGVGETPPVQFAANSQEPVIGYPVPVRSDGTIILPLIPEIKAQGITVEELEAKVKKAYTEDKQLLKPKAKILITLQSRRKYRVLVIREDAGALTVSPAGTLGSARRGTGKLLYMPAYQNDVLTALAETGGLPGFDATNEVFVLRGGIRDGVHSNGTTSIVHPDLLRSMDRSGQKSKDNIVRLPLRLYPDEPIPFDQKDVILNDGDIVYVRARTTEVFYTAGLIDGGEFILPRDYDLDVLEAVARVRGPLFNGGLSQNNFTGQVINVGLGFPSPSQLTVIRKTQGGGQIAINVDLNKALIDSRERILVMPGDVLVLQETLGESFTRYFTTVFRYDFMWDIVTSPDATGFGMFTGPQS